MNGSDSANSPSESEPLAPRPLSGDEVAAFLRRNPDFLLQRPELLSVLTPPARSQGDDVIDMQRFMIERQRHEIESKDRNQRELIRTSRRNMNTQSRVHGAALAVIGANSLEQLVEVITTDLAVRLEVDVIRLCVEAKSGGRRDALPRGLRVLPPGSIDRVMGTDRDVVLGPVVRPEPAVYGSARTLVASEALLRLHISTDSPAGLLALGSRETEMFDPGLGTELLGFLARVIENTIRIWIGLPA